MLLDNKADINLGKYWTPLREASAKGHQKVVEVLLKYDANIVDEYGSESTALSSAARNGHKGTVEILLKTIANFNLKIEYKHYEYALQEAHDGEIARMIREYRDKYFQWNSVANQSVSQPSAKDIP